MKYLKILIKFRNPKRMTINGIVMAGGKGTRLRPITYSIPKPLVPIAGYPCIEYTVESFYKAGIRDLIITTGYKFEALISGVLDLKHQDQNILFSVEKEAAGTAGSVKLVEKFIDDTIVVGSGDILADFDIADIISFHRNKKAKVTIVLSEVEDTSQLGIVDLKNDRIQRFLEKPSPEESFSKIVNAGIYVIEPEILEKIPYGEPYDFGKQLFPKLISEGETIHGYVGKGTWIDTGRPNDMIRANQVMTEKYGTDYSKERFTGRMILNTNERKLGGNISGNSFIGSDVSMSKGSEINSSAVYNNVTVEKNVKIDNSLILDSVRIKSGTTIENSVIMRGTVIGENCEIHDSVLSPKLNLQDGSRVYNVSLASEIVEDQ